MLMKARKVVKHHYPARKGERKSVIYRTFERADKWALKKFGKPRCVYDWFSPRPR